MDLGRRQDMAEHGWAVENIHSIYLCAYLHTFFIAATVTGTSGPL